MSAPEIVRFVMDETTRFISPLQVAVEWIIVALTAALVASAPRRAYPWLRSAALRFKSLAGRKSLSVVVCGLAPVAIRLSMLGIAPPPEPSIHDEFSHLLLADTLAHGRLTNPTHPMWRHFETIHVIQKPTYNSMYPPAQGMFLALGQVIFHAPWAGVIISCALMFGAMCWMMQGWLPPAWALYGTLIAVLKFGVVGFWMNSYVGGAVPGFAGALLIGSLPRLCGSAPRAFHAALFACAVVLLMNSRPFEGAFLTAAAGLYWMISVVVRRKKCTHAWPRRAGASLAAWTRLLLPAALILVCGAAFTAYYCARVAGSPFRMPYQVNRDTYGWPENLGFLPVKVVAFHDPVLKAMYEMETRHRDIYKSADAFLDNLVMRLFENWTFFIGPALTVPFIFLPWLIRDRRIRPLLIFLAVVAALNLFQMVLYPYHLAPIVPVLFALVAQAVRRLYVAISRLSRTAGALVPLALPLSLVLVGAMKQEAMALGLPQAYWEHAAEPHGQPRAAIEKWLAARPRKQLVIVRYAPGHTPNQEWVYNHADIDASQVVWARDIDTKSNAKLLEYFHDREAWLLDADRWPQHLIQYSRRADLPVAGCSSACPWNCNSAPDSEQCELSDK
ncbi:MAG TPA: hypothetical protein VFA28_11050 [Bryobacteraceae bacterium]|nr:hypothetical protein [Bryobacteraceae bacterium]